MDTRFQAKCKTTLGDLGVLSSILISRAAILLASASGELRLVSIQQIHGLPVALRSLTKR